MATQHAAVARVIATYGRQFGVELPDGRLVRARMRGRRLKPVCCDRVRIEAGQDGDWTITGIERRDTELSRPDSRGRAEVLAANMSMLAVVAAPKPSPDWFVVDRYLAAAETMPTAAVLVFNKDDLESNSSAAEELRAYERVGYLVVTSNSRDADGVASFLSAIAGHTAICVGQSGVGKTSLINALLPDAALPTSRISSKSGEGRHTTVNSRRFEAGTDTYIIDSPGVRDFAPAFTDPAVVSAGFREVAEAAPHCRFADCRHLREPDCAVKGRVDDGRISPRRYESYRRLLRLTERFTTRR